MNIKWNKVTTLSKTLAMIIFIAFPFAGFYLGMRYGEMTTTIRITRMEMQEKNALSKKMVIQGSGDTQKPVDVSLRVISPNGGENVCIGQDLKIQWEHTGMKTVSVWVKELTAGSNNGVQRLVGNFPADFNETGAMGSGLALWKVNTSAGYVYEVRITGKAMNESLEMSDTSDNVFQVVNCAGQINSSF